MNEAPARRWRLDSVHARPQGDEDGDADDRPGEDAIKRASRDGPHEQRPADGARERRNGEPDAAEVVRALQVGVGDGPRGRVEEHHKQRHRGDRVRVPVRVEQEQDGHQNEPAARAHERAEQPHGRAEQDEKEVLVLRSVVPLKPLERGRGRPVAQTGISGVSPCSKRRRNSRPRPRIRSQAPPIRS